MSYALFAIVTIILGAVVGLILVCIIDFIWPQKPMDRKTFSEVQEKEKLISRSNEMINEDIVDDTGADQNEDDETSEAEKNSGSDDEEEEEVPKEPSPKSSPDVRKRRTRKAD
jgi:FtsZ-interacting cell division protein ZipA